MTRKPGALGWRDWSLEEARHQQQLELELPLRSTDRRRAEDKQARKEANRRKRRRAHQPGVYLP